MAKMKATADQPVDQSLYTPSTEDAALVADLENRYDKAVAMRRPYEGQWYLNAAFIRGQQWVEWDDHRRVLSVEAAPQRRIRRTFNLILPKVRARQAKFQKNRPRPEVKPATTDIKDILDARMTTKVLDFNWRHLGLEEAYVSALGWAMRTGHGYWWFRWDEDLTGRVKLTDEQSGEVQVQEGVLGDVSVEISSPFEMVVADPTIERVGRQPWIMRARMRPLEWIKRYKDGKFVQPDGPDDSSMGYDRQIGQLSPTNQLGVGVTASPQSNDEDPKSGLVKEFFEAPCTKYPKGRQVVFSNGVLLKKVDELPYGMWDMRFNPYPVVDFIDLDVPGQYWGPTVVEQLIGPNRQYNRIRSRLEEHLRLLMGGKLLVARQHNVPKTAWTSGIGELIEYQAHPNIPPPQIWTPPPVVSDTWRVLERLTEEIDTISQIYPEAEGRVGQSTSGFQTNLLQEATDAVHAPDIRRHERAIEEAAWKIRRLMKLMYTVPRLVSITSNDDQTEAFEFSQGDIDDHADIIVQVGSGLPDLKGAKIQMALELRNSGIFGDPADPEVNRKVLSMLDMGDLGTIYASARRDEERARLENIEFEEGRVADTPLFCDNHDIHSRTHTDLLKSPATKRWDPEIFGQFIDHILWHAVYVNPQSAAQIAMIYGRQVPQLPMPPPPGQAAAPQGPPPQPEMPMSEGSMPPDVMAQMQAQMAPPPMDPMAAASGANQMNPEFGFGAQGANTMMPM